MEIDEIQIILQKHRKLIIGAYFVVFISTTLSVYWWINYNYCYKSETQFLIQNIKSDKAVLTDIDGELDIQSSKITNIQDIYPIYNYIYSREILEGVSKKFNLQSHYRIGNSPDVQERIHNILTENITITISPTNVLTLTVKDADRKFAYNISKELLNNIQNIYNQTLISKINDRINILDKLYEKISQSMPLDLNKIRVVVDSASLLLQDKRINARQITSLINTINENLNSINIVTGNIYNAQKKYKWLAESIENEKPINFTIIKYAMPEDPVSIFTIERILTILFLPIILTFGLLAILLLEFNKGYLKFLFTKQKSNIKIAVLKDDILKKAGER